MTSKKESKCVEEVVTTTCASHCGGSCILKLHLKNGVIARIETDDSNDIPDGSDILLYRSGSGFDNHGYSKDS